MITAGKTKLTMSLLAGLLACSGLAGAHHSNAMFDKAVVREVTATVREFQWTNPHIWIQVLVKNEHGVEEEWSIEGGGPNTLFRKGCRRNKIQPDARWLAGRTVHRRAICGRHDTGQLVET